MEKWNVRIVHGKNIRERKSWKAQVQKDWYVTQKKKKKLRDKYARLESGMEIGNDIECQTEPTRKRQILGKKETDETELNAGKFFGPFFNVLVC